jgi:dCMP deaminase
MPRPSKNEYFLGIAEAIAQRSTCIRRQYGAVIVKNDVIVATGYNGSPRNAVNCCDAGACWRSENNIPHGERYEMCQAVHAEANAIINANRADMEGATLYLVGLENGKRIDAKPCALCGKLIRNAQIRRVES